jgi:hypothetical protein
MKIGCRIGWHAWGRWSAKWSRQVATERGLRYDVVRSLECAHCGMNKHELVDSLMLHPGDAINRVAPEWVPRQQTPRLRLIKGGHSNGRGT